MNAGREVLFKDRPEWLLSERNQSIKASMMSEPRHKEACGRGFDYGWREIKKRTEVQEEMFRKI